jgi:hypothetical protein
MSDVNKVGQGILTFDRADYRRICVGFKGMKPLFRNVIAFFGLFLDRHLCLM